MNPSQSVPVCKQCGVPLTGRQVNFCSHLHGIQWHNHERALRGIFVAQYRRRFEAGYYHDTCPDCGLLKSSVSKRCLKCHHERVRVMPPVRSRVIAPRQKHPRLARPRIVIADPRCPNCDVGMRAVEWHSKTIWHCIGCGLETSMEELKRIAIEQGLRAA